MERKKGITFLALVITIVVALILLSSAIGMISNAISNSRITNFTEEMNLLEQQVRMYYIENKRLPTKGESKTTESIINSVSRDDSELIKEEIIENGDSDSIGFYTIDLEILNISRVQLDQEYVVAIPSLNVYSLTGIKANGKKYFSISNKINGSYSTISNEFMNDLYTEVYVTEGLNVTRELSGWTNLLGIKIDTYMDSGEFLYVIFDGKEVQVETEMMKLNEIKFDSLLSTDRRGLKVSSASEYNFTTNDVEKLSTISSDKKYIDIVKKGPGGTLISKVKVNLNNMDLKAPYMNSNTTITSGTTKNIVEFLVDDELSGPRDVRYEYYTTYDRNDGNMEPNYYYSGTSITDEYLKYAGKVAKVSSDKKVLIELPSSVSSIKFIVTDNASNMSQVYEIETIPEHAIYYSVKSITDGKLNIAFYGNGITSGTVQYSKDGIKYSDKISWNADEYFIIDDMKDINDKIYLKVITDDITRIISLQVPEKFNIGTGVKTNSNYKTPYVPNGFVHTEGTVDEGFVIQDITSTNTKYNEFVWVPVDGKKIKYGKSNFGVGDIASFQNVLLDNVDAFVETSEKSAEIEQSIKKYGGFYVGRYEAGVLNTSGDNEGLPSTTKNATVWTDISLEKAYSNSNLMYKDNLDISSTLMTAATYDTLMNWLSTSKYNVREYTRYTSMLGNFSGTITTTGKNEEYVLNNIYDICGNVAELTTETYKTSPVFRGGSYSSADGNQVASVRAYNLSSSILPTIGYRVIVYIK